MGFRVYLHVPGEGVGFLVLFQVSFDVVAHAVRGHEGVAQPPHLQVRDAVALRLQARAPTSGFRV